MPSPERVMCLHNIFFQTQISTSKRLTLNFYSWMLGFLSRILTLLYELDSRRLDVHSLKAMAGNNRGFLTSITEECESFMIAFQGNAGKSALQAFLRDEVALRSCFS